MIPLWWVLGPNENIQQQEPTTDKTQHIIQTEKKEAVSHGWLGSWADGNLYLYYPIEYHQAVTRRRVS